MEENMAAQKMLEKIAELDHNQCMLRDLNAEMRKWLDAADDDMAVLRLENEALRKKVKTLEKIVSDTQQVEGKACSSLADDLDANRCNKEKIQKLERESTMMKEQNENLTAEIKHLQQERDQGKLTLNNLRVALQALEVEVEEAQLGLQHKDEIVHQKNLELKHLDETVKEYSNIIKDLRLTNQELKKQLEDKLDEASFDLMREKEDSLSPHLSFAEEIKLLASTAEMKINMIDSTDIRDEEAEAEELQKPRLPLVDLQTKRCADALETPFQRAGLFILCIFILVVLAFLALGSYVGKYYFFSINTLWSSVHCSVHYGALPPI